MSELLTGDVSSRAQVGGSDFSRDPESFDAELDACLDRALASEPSEDEDTVPESFATGPLRTLLDLASTEEAWMQSLPPPSNDNAEPELTLSAEAANFVIPEWLRAEESASSASQEASWGAMTSWDPAAPSPAWATPGSPAAAYAPQPWMPYAPEAPEPPPPAIADASTRILGMSPMSFVSAVAMGALAAGLIVVAGLRLTSKDDAQAARPAPQSQAVLGTMPSNAPPRAMGTQDGARGTQSFAGPQSGTQSAAGTPPFTGAQSFSSAPDFAQSIAGAVNTPALTDAQRAAQALTPNAPVLAGPSSAGLTTGLHTLAPDFTPSTQSAPVTKKKAPVAQRAATLEAPEDTGEVREMSFGGEISEEEMARARQAAAEAEAEAAAPTESEIDEDFARELGFTDEAESPEASASKQAQEKTVYIPPAPTSERDSLTPADVTNVVVTHQPAVAACVQNFKAGTALENGGRFQMRWSVDTTGTVSGVAMETEALKGSPLAGCIEDQVRGWKFPVHRVAMNAPVRFPFVF
ncbi:AgmX/PglI C-terminal domain-containing protein [Corallococcus carmarthensis]|uniref:AgmX/PglI C-terminal domain-containing protein n=1 Tax=Corallococcus carmarthensis TaxID=2316728 RepID=UPI00148E4FD5|nr:AgmX/PglI C-terminal domain-containing protein [Corallococcus carmarthensis]